jgi:hypothetical protein
MEIIGESLRAIDGFRDVRNDTVAPTADLVAEQLQPTCRPCSDRSLGDNATLRAVAGPNRRLLYDVPSVRHVDFERGVVQVALISPLDSRRESLEHAAVQSDRVTAGSEREPIQVDSSSRNRHGEP